MRCFLGYTRRGSQEKQAPTFSRGTFGDQRHAIRASHTLRKWLSEAAGCPQQAHTVRDTQISARQNLEKERITPGCYQKLRVHCANLVAVIPFDPHTDLVEQIGKSQSVDGHT